LSKPFKTLKDPLFCRYYNDLWSLDLSELAWTPLGSPGQHPWPAARSGCQMMVVGDVLYMYGGYVKVCCNMLPVVLHQGCCWVAVSVRVCVHVPSVDVGGVLCMYRGYVKVILLWCFCIVRQCLGCDSGCGCQMMVVGEVFFMNGVYVKVRRLDSSSAQLVSLILVCHAGQG
jgi:hypothetical protein